MKPNSITHLTMLSFYTTVYGVTNENDIALCEKAESMYWGDIDEDAAATPEGKEALHSIMMSGYHREEYACGML